MLSKNRLKQIQALHLKKNRDLEKRFIAEGKKTVQEMIDSCPQQIEELFATPAFIEHHQELLNNNDFKITEASEDDFKKISLQSTPAGVLAICTYFEPSDATIGINQKFSFYLDEIRDPGNFGTIIRLADWFGIGTVFCSQTSCDLYNPKVIQSTMGAFMRVKLIYIDLEELLQSQKTERVYGAVLNGKDLYREELKSGLIVIGNEANGISAENLQRVNFPITIPANHNAGTESLNAAMAASIIASEFFRQLRS